VNEYAVPWSNEAEQAVLGAMLLDQEAIAKAGAALEGSMFYREAHRMLFTAMLALAARGAAVDPVTLREELVRCGDLDRIGGMEYLGSLIDTVPTAANVEHHARIVAEKAARRDVIRQATAVLEAAGNGSTPEQLQEAVKCLRAPREISSAQAFSPPLLADFTAENATPVRFVVHGYAARGAVTIWAGLAKVGKTTAVANIEGEVSVGANSLGQPTEPCAVLHIDLEQPQGLTARTLTRHCVPGAPVYVQWGSLPPLPTVAAWCVEHEVGLVVLDSLTKVYKAFGVEDENDPVQVERALQPLLEFARAANVALIILHHLRKSGGDDGLDVRGSGQIAAAVDILVSFRRFSPELDDSRRVLQAVSRFEETPRQLVVEYLDHRYRVCGTMAQVRRQKERDQVMAALTTESQTADEVARASGLAASAARTVLKELADEHVIERTGSGKKGDPFRYMKALRA
jgi:hypothetical protein